MNSISYLAQRAEEVLRTRLKEGDQDPEDTPHSRECDEQGEVEPQKDEAFDGTVVVDTEHSGKEQEGDFKEATRSVFSLTYLISIIMFVPNLIIIQPISYIWFILTFPLSLLEHPRNEYHESDSNPVIDNYIKEPFDELQGQSSLKPRSNDPAPYPTNEKQVFNSTIFETAEEEQEEEEEQESHVLDEKSTPIDVKSPTSPSPSILLSSGEVKSSSDTKQTNLTSRGAQRSFLTFPKTIFPTSLINSNAKKTLVLDLDETLIHSISRGTRVSVGSGHMIEVGLQNQVPTLYYVYKRPYCDLFLKQVSKWFNLAIFTASVKEYADPVIDWLELERNYFKKRYYRNNCTLRKGQGYIKDLSTVDKNLNNLIIIDNSPISYAMHENNAIVVEGWINDPSDADLLNLIPLLSSLRYTTDVRAVLSLKNGAAAFERG